MKTRICIILNGFVLLTAPLASQVWAPAAAIGVSGPGELFNPTDVIFTTAPSPSLYVTDTNRLLQYNGDGLSFTFSKAFTFPSGTFLSAVAVDSAGVVYVADLTNSRIHALSHDLHLLLTWGSKGSGNLQLDAPQGLAIDFSDILHIADKGNARIARHQFQQPSSVTNLPPIPIMGGAEFAPPLDVAISDSGRIFAALGPTFIFPSGPRVWELGSDGTITTLMVPDDDCIQGGPVTLAVEEPNESIWVNWRPCGKTRISGPRKYPADGSQVAEEVLPAATNGFGTGGIHIRPSTVYLVDVDRVIVYRSYPDASHIPTLSSVGALALALLLGMGAWTLLRR